MLSMRIPWSKSKSTQLDLLDDGVLASVVDETGDEPKAIAPVTATSRPPSLAALPTPHEPPACTTLAGRPLLVPTASLYEDPGNPRTEFPACDRLDGLSAASSPRTPTRSRCPNWSPRASVSKTSRSTGCRGLTVRPHRRPTAEPMEIGVKRVERGGWQDRLAASEWTPVPGRRRVAHGTGLS